MKLVAGTMKRRLNWSEVEEEAAAVEHETDKMRGRSQDWCGQWAWAAGGGWGLSLRQGNLGEEQLTGPFLLLCLWRRNHRKCSVNVNGSCFYNLLGIWHCRPSQHLLRSSQKGKKGKLICSVCHFLEYKYVYHGQFQASHMMSTGSQNSWKVNDWLQHTTTSV